MMMINNMDDDLTSPGPDYKWIPRNFSMYERECPCFILAGVCFVSFLGGLIFVTGAGEYWVSLFDGYASTTGLVIIALLEIVSVMYIYGHER